MADDLLGQIAEAYDADNRRLAQEATAMPNNHLTADQLVEILTDNAMESGIVRRLAADLLAARALPAELQEERDEARSWARHGYEIGQRSATWTDEGVAPKWLTEGHSREALDCSAELKARMRIEEQNIELKGALRDVRRILADLGVTNVPPRLAVALEGLDQ